MFVFKGISSEDMGVIVEEEDQFLARAAQRYEKIEIEGRNGAIFNENGYATVEKNINILIVDTKKLDKIFSWLNGTGELEINGRITKARFYNQIDPLRLVTIKTADVSFTREPFWTKKRDEYITVKNFIYNEGNVYSEPLLLLERTTSQKIDVTVNDVRFVYDFKNENYVEIDCEEQLVTYNKENRNRQIEIGYKFPKLEQGLNKITVNSGDATIKVKRKDRWL